MRTPYYADDTVTLYHGDAAEMIGNLTADRGITDPPYGFGAYETDRVASSDVLGLLLDLPTMAVFGYPEALVRWCITHGKAPDEWVTWWSTANKSRAYGSALARESEHVAIFGEIHGERIHRPRSRDAWARGVSISRGLDPDWCRDGDVWRDAAEGVGSNGHLRIHPNQKPISLMRRLVELCSDPGEIVLDPYAGSGTTLRAAKDLGRRAIGIEIDERFCEIAARRLSQEVLDFSEAAS